MAQNEYILTVDKPLDIVQTTESVGGQEIQTIILSLKEDSETIMFN